jgi:hypothetical protein
MIHCCLVQTHLFFFIGLRMYSYFSSYFFVEKSIKNSDGLNSIRLLRRLLSNSTPSNKDFLFYAVAVFKFNERLFYAYSKRVCPAFLPMFVRFSTVDNTFCYNVVPSTYIHQIQKPYEDHRKFLLFCLFLSTIGLG